MPKANDTDIYNYDEYPSLKDYLFGTEFDNQKKNKSYRLNSIIGLINEVNGINNLQFIFSDGSNPQIDYYSRGYFFTDNNETNPADFTKLILSKQALQPKDLTTLFDRLSEIENIVIKIENPSNANNFFSFRIISITNETDFFVFNIEIFQDFFSGELMDNTIYSFRFDIKKDGVVGEDGAQGMQGPEGPQGIKGDPGLPGAKGETGAQGIQGVKGDQGLKGIKGDTGIQGLQGIQGIPGVKGDQGLQGISGPRGIQGLQGIQGIKGEQGLKGLKGDTGLQGQQGIQGIQGEAGVQGVQGIKGDAGISGETGLQGFPGEQGIAGPIGPIGPQGVPGKDAPPLDVTVITEIQSDIEVLQGLQNLRTNFTGKAYAVWTGIGLIYDVFYPNYYINYVLYPGNQQQITLDPSDVTNPRIDAIAVDATGAIKITGDATADPVAATVNTDTQILITTVYLNTGAVTPTNVSELAVYKENVEFTGVSNNGTVNFNAGAGSFAGTKHIDCGAFTNGQYLKFTDLTTRQVADFSLLKFYVNLKAAFASTAKFSIRFYNNNTLISSAVNVDSGKYNFVRTTINAYQTIVIPLSDFTFSGSAFNRIDIVFAGTNASGFKMDNIVLSVGAGMSSPEQNAITTIVADIGVATATTKDDMFVFRGVGGLIISVVGKVISFTQAVQSLANYYTKSEIDSKISSVYVWKGNVADFASLPPSNTVGLQIGHVYNILSTGANYGWTGTVWDKLGDTVDISGKEDTSNKTNIVVGNETSTSFYASIKGIVDYFTGTRIRTLLNITTLSGSNTGDQNLDGLVETLSTGIISGGELSINADNTKFNVAAGKGYIVNHTVTPATFIPISWNAFTAQTVTNLTTSFATDIAINSSGAIVQQNSYTTAQLRSLIFLGGLDHSSKTNIGSVFTIQKPSNAPASNVADLASAIGDINVDGNVYYANGVNLQVNKSAGVVYSYGRNNGSNKNNPSEIVNILQTALSFGYVFNDGLGNGVFGAQTTSINPNSYDNGSGTLVPVANNKFTIQRFLFFPNGQKTFIQPGTQEYASQDDAVSAISTANFVALSGIKSAMTRGYLIVKKGETDLSGTTTKFIPANRFGFVSGGGSSTAVTTLEPNSATVTTTVSISSATLTDISQTQEGKVVRIMNGINVINYTVNGLTASFVKGGTGQITFVQGAGRTLTGANGTLVMNGVVNSTASLVSFGTEDRLYINNLY